MTRHRQDLILAFRHAIINFMNRKRINQTIFWALSLLVVLSMALGLVISVMPRPRLPTPTPLLFSFAVCGESPDNASICSQLLRQIAEDDSVFLIHTGNLVPMGSKSNFQEFAKLTVDFLLPFYPVPGNHDYYQGTLDNFLRYSGAPDAHYSFNHGPVHLALSNSGQGDMNSEELDWLRADLKSSEQPLKMVFLHYPPFTPGGRGEAMRSGSGKFMALMEEQRVDYVFAGHIRGYHTEERNGMRYIFTSGGDPHHYVHVTVQGTEVTVGMVHLEGSQ
ncbi:MAG: metallophosphoesterase [Chloroflexota bacterium]|nr:metallophosphoesterase [Chloroflexota bacterium]